MRRGDDNGAGSVKLPFHQSGSAGWLLLVLLVAGWDIFAPETLSAAFDRAAATPEGRVLVVAGWGLVTLHLLANGSRLDPLRAGRAAWAKVVCRA